MPYDAYGGPLLKNLAKGVVTLAVSALAIAFLGASNVPTLPMPTNAAMIYNPGSGDYAGFRIVVTPDGRAISIDAAGHSSAQLQSDVVEKFFNDLASVGPLEQLSGRPCTSSADVNAPTTVEVNSSITISWRGQHSPALSCVTDSRAQRLLLDATQIQHALYVQAYRTRNLATYGTPYEGAAPTYVGYESSSRFSFDNFYGGGFTNTPFSNGHFYMDHFSNGLQYVNPFTGSPYSGTPYTALPYAALPSASPFSGLPYSNPYNANPFSGSPYSGNPFSGSPFTSPYTSGPTYTTSAP